MDSKHSRLDPANHVEDPFERIARNALILLVLLFLTSALFWSWGGAVSVGLGGLLAWLNFRWLKSGVEAILSTQEAPPPRSVITRFVGRLLLILICLFAMIQLSFLSLIGAVIGLSIFVLSGIFEAICQLLRQMK